MFSANAAYAFRCDASLDELFERLRQCTSWTWLRRDGERHGAYISAMTHADWGIVRVYVEPDHYVFDVEYASRRPAAKREYEALLELVAEQILPRVGARDVRTIDGYGR